MSTRLGLDAKLYRNTGTAETPVWSEIGNVKDLTLTLERGETDVTTRANGGWRATKGGLKDASIEFQMLWNSDDTHFAALRTAFLNGASVELAAMSGPMNVETSEGLRATCEVLSFTRNEALEDAIAVDVTIKPTAAAAAPAWINGEED